MSKIPHEFTTPRASESNSSTLFKVNLDIIIDFIKNVGFPIAIAFYLLFVVNQSVNALIHAVNELSGLVKQQTTLLIDVKPGVERLNQEADKWEERWRDKRSDFKP